MTRLPLLAALAGLIVLAFGVALFSGGGPGPAPTTVSPSPTTSAAASSSPGPVPAAVKGGWTAASRGTALEDPDITTIVLGGSAMDQFAPEFSVDRPGFTRILGSNVVEESPGVLRITLSTPANSGCATRDQGTYGWRTSADGQWLTLELVEDACQARSDIVAGTWQRNLGFRSNGGPGIATVFEPLMSFTLPAAPLTGREYAEIDTVVIDGTDDRFTFKAWKDPDGFVDPCDPDMGRVDLDPGIDPFIAYMSDDSGMVVTKTTETTIDGRRAVSVDFTTDPALGPTGCGPEGSVLQWIPNASPGGDWHLLHGLEDTVLVTEVSGATIVFEIAQATFASGTTDDGFVVPQDVVDSIRFLDALPTPPAS